MIGSSPVGGTPIAAAPTPAVSTAAPAQGGDPAPLPHLGLLLAASGGGPTVYTRRVFVSPIFESRIMQ